MNGDWTDGLTPEEIRAECARVAALAGTHGERSGWDHGCRCPECISAARNTGAADVLPEGSWIQPAPGAPLEAAPIRRVRRPVRDLPPGIELVMDPLTAAEEATE